MKDSATSIAPLIVRNFVSFMLKFADKSIVYLSEKYKLLELIRCVFVACFVFLLRLLPSLTPSFFFYNDDSFNGNRACLCTPNKKDRYKHVVYNNRNNEASVGVSSSGIARALTQSLSIMNDIPVSSRKYEIIRSLAEQIIEDNNREGNEVLREINCMALSTAFTRTLGQLEAVALDAEWEGGDEIGSCGIRMECKRLTRFLKAVGDVGGWSRRKLRGRQLNRPAEKLAAELLWLAEKMAGCCRVDEAVCKWAAATELGGLALTAEPRVQGSLVKVSAFLFRQAKDIGMDEIDEGKREQHKQTQLRMLLSWLPLLCRANNGTDSPVLSIGERAEIERILEETIGKLEQQEQEQVLSLWIYHFSYCSSTDWPNLHASYGRWCSASRKQLIIQ